MRRRKGTWYGEVVVQVLAIESEAIEAYLEERVLQISPDDQADWDAMTAYYEVATEAELTQLQRLLEMTPAEAEIAIAGPPLDASFVPPNVYKTARATIQGAARLLGYD